MAFHEHMMTYVETSCNPNKSNLHKISLESVILFWSFAESSDMKLQLKKILGIPWNLAGYHPHQNTKVATGEVQTFYCRRFVLFMKKNPPSFRLFEVLDIIFFPTTRKLKYDLWPFTGVYVLLSSTEDTQTTVLWSLGFVTVIVAW